MLRTPAAFSTHAKRGASRAPVRPLATGRASASASRSRSWVRPGWASARPIVASQRRRTVRSAIAAFEAVAQARRKRGHPRMRLRYSGANALNERCRVALPATCLRLRVMLALRSLLFAALLVTAVDAAPAYALSESLQQRVEAALAAAPTGTRFGLVVTAEDGSELVAINPDNRFMPASNTKMLTTAAAFAALSGLDQPDLTGGAAVRIEGHGRTADVILTGHGDARLSSAPDCIANCLAALADAVRARTRRVRHVI